MSTSAVDVVDEPTPKSDRDFLSYAGFLLFLTTVTAPSGFIQIPVQFFLKDHLHATPSGIAMFGFVTGIPLYLSFLFGMLRDQWHPFNEGDRGYFKLFAPIAALGYGLLALDPTTLTTLISGIIAMTILTRILTGACQGLVTSVSKSRGLTGSVSTLWNTITAICQSANPLLGGWLAQVMPLTDTFLIAAALTFGLAAIGSWKPAAVQAFDASTTSAKPKLLMAEMTRLVQHKPLGPAALIWALWQCAPALYTPFLIYMTDTLKLSHETYGHFFALINLGFVPIMLCYGRLSRRFPLRTLLLVGTGLAIPQMLLLLTAHTSTQLMIVAVIMGFMGGIGMGAFFDLLMRSCPNGLEGTGMMLGTALNLFAMRGGDILGTWIFTHHGFQPTVIVSVAICSLILPSLLLVPRNITGTSPRMIAV